MGNRATRRARGDRPQVRSVIFEGEAFAEYRDAALHYAAENAEVALRFIEQVEALMERIRREPHLWPLDITVARKLGVRRCRIDGFPHSILFMETASAVHVIAIAHGRRRDGYWSKRV